MIGPVFVDANVLVYAAQANAPDNKRLIAVDWMERLWREDRGRVSVQVLNEFYVTLTRKIRPAFKADDAWDRVQALMGWVTRSADVVLLDRAREIERRYRLSWWDSLIVASADAECCDILLTEDLQDRAVYGTVTVRNPFVLGVSEPVPEYSAQPSRPPRHRPRGRPKTARTAA